MLGLELILKESLRGKLESEGDKIFQDKWQTVGEKAGKLNLEQPV